MISGILIGFTALVLAGLLILGFRYLLERRAFVWQNRLLMQNVEETRNIYKTMRGWRHDYHSHLQVLKAYLAEGKLAEAQQYLNGLETDLDEIRPMFESENVSLDAILNSKLSLAMSQNIEIRYKVEVPPIQTVSDIDLCVIIGNLLDNATEACGAVKAAGKEDMEKPCFIRVYIGVFKEQLYISVVNSTAETARRLDEEYISHKRGNHGHGLLRIDRVVKKYGGFINRKNEPGVFATEIMLPL